MFYPRRQHRFRNKVRQIPIDSNSECSASDDVFNSGSATLQRLWEHISRRRGADMFLLLNNRHIKIRTCADGIRNAPERKAEADSIIPIVVFCKDTRHTTHAISLQEQLGSYIMMAALKIGTKLASQHIMCSIFLVRHSI